MAVELIRENSDSAVSVECYSGLNVLAHAQLNELEIGSRCGGHGVCGGDRIQIFPEDQSKLSAITESELEHLTAGEIEQGWRLACQSWPIADDLEIKIHLGPV